MSFMKQNAERVMFFIFPVVFIGLFVVAAVLWWLVQTFLQGQPG